MTKLLLKLFVKNHQNTQDPKVHTAIGKLAGATGIVCNCLLSAMKLVIGLLVGSMAIVADGVNNLSDAASSAMTLLGFRMAQRPADEDHPYGHARYEYLSGLAVAGLILLIGAELVKSSVNKILHPVPPEISVATLVILGASIAVKLWMADFNKALGKSINSATLMAASVDSRNDVVATGAVLAGCLINYFFGFNIDGYIGLAVALFILCSGVNIAKETISPLLGKQADKHLVQELSNFILSYDKVLGIHDLLIHDYGPGQCYASVHAEFCAEESPLLCHDIIDDMEWDVLEKMNIHLVVHYDPVVQNDQEQDALLETITSLVSSIDPQLTIHDFRIVRDTKIPKAVFDLSVPYAMTPQRRQIKKAIDEGLKQTGKEYITVIRFDGNA